MRADLTLSPLSPAEFRARVTPALSDHEAENGLAIGIAERLATALATGSSPSGASPVERAGAARLLSIENGGSVVGAAVWTPPHDVVVTRLPTGAAALIAQHCVHSGQTPTGASGPDDAGLELAQELARQLGATARVRSCQRLYELVAVEAVPRAPGAMRRATADDIPRLAGWYAAFASEAGVAHPASPVEWARAAAASGSAFLWEAGGEPRCLACLSRETPNGRAIGPVYTPPSGRRQGYATTLVAELSRSVLESGKRFVCLFTDAMNPTSNHIYQSIGYRPVCRFDAYSLVPVTS